MEYIGNINLSNQDDYQAIYASQLYGTFFSVFGKFTCSKSDKDEYILEKIAFKIINYKGVINLGISNVKGIYEIPNDNGIIQKTINIEVQALNTADEFELDCTGVKLKKNELFIAERTLKPMHNGMALNNSAFDDEFYYREGMPEEGGFQARINPVPVSTYNPNVEAMASPGTKCPRATNRIV